eukprot:3831425-Pyramimonas_sp.AAC.1
MTTTTTTTKATADDRALQMLHVGGGRGAAHARCSLSTMATTTATTTTTTATTTATTKATTIDDDGRRRTAEP